MPVQSLGRRSLLAMAAASVPAAAWSRPVAEEGGGLWRSLVLEGPDGRTFRVGAGAAPLTMLAMWAHWCPACLVEMPSLSALSAALGGQLDVVLVSHPEYWERDLAVAQSRRIPHRLATLSGTNSPGAVAAALLVDGGYEVPRSLVLRRDASVAWSHLGSMDWGSGEAIRQMRVLAQA